MPHYLPATTDLLPLRLALKRLAGVTTNSANATNCVSLYDLRGIHCIKLIPNPYLLRRINLAQVLMATLNVGRFVTLSCDHNRLITLA